jgi:putative transposase
MAGNTGKFSTSSQCEVFGVSRSGYYAWRHRQGHPTGRQLFREKLDRLVHHSDQGSQYLSIRYTERLADAGIEPSVASVGDAYDNAMAESVIGLYKTEVINKQGPWRHRQAVEFATLAWVYWFNNRRLLEPIGNIPPVELEQMYYQEQESKTMVA